MSVVRAEYGPTLPELLAPRWRALPRRRRLLAGAAVAAAAVVAAAVAALLLLRGGESEIAVTRPVAFTLRYDDALRRVAPAPGELVALRTRGGRRWERMGVRALHLAPYSGDPTAALMGRSAAVIRRLRASVPGFVLRGEGRAIVNGAQGYQVQYAFKRRGRTAYGRRAELLPASMQGRALPRGGVVLDLRAARSRDVRSVAGVGTDGALETPFRTFTLGT